MMKVILPNTFVEEPLDGPLVFTAGPISGGGGWQQRFIEQAAATRSNIVVASPVRDPKGALRMIDGVEVMSGKNDHFVRQTDWESYYIKLAMQTGCLMFWVPCEDQNEPRTKGSYAMGTRFELGEYCTRASLDPVLRVVVGIEQGFPGRSPNVHRIEQLLGKGLVHNNYEETAQAATALARV